MINLYLGQPVFLADTDTDTTTTTTGSYQQPVLADGQVYIVRGLTDDDRQVRLLVAGSNPAQYITVNPNRLVPWGCLFYETDPDSPTETLHRGTRFEEERQTGLQLCQPLKIYLDFEEARALAKEQGKRLVGLRAGEALEERISLASGSREYLPEYGGAVLFKNK